MTTFIFIGSPSGKLSRFVTFENCSYLVERGNFKWENRHLQTQR
jgi:hypothetical protein